MARRPSSVRLSVRLSVCLLTFAQIASSRRQMAGSLPNFHKMDSRSACIQDMLKVKVKGHVIRALSRILGMSYSVINGLVWHFPPTVRNFSIKFYMPHRCSYLCYITTKFTSYAQNVLHWPKHMLASSAIFQKQLGILVIFYPPITRSHLH